MDCQGLRIFSLMRTPTINIKSVRVKPNSGLEVMASISVPLFYFLVIQDQGNLLHIDFDKLNQMT